MAKNRREFGSIIRRKGSNGEVLPGFYLRYRALQDDGTKKVRQIKADGKTERDARAHLDRIRVEENEKEDALAKGGGPPEPKSDRPLTVMEVFRKCRVPILVSKGTTARHQRAVEFHVRRIAKALGEDVLVRDVTTGDIEIAMAKVTEEEDLAPRTARLYLVSIGSVFRAALRHGLVTRNPCEGVGTEKPTKKVVPYLDREQGDRLLGAIRADVRPWAALTLETGLRISECDRLEWRDVDLGKRPNLTVRKSKNGDPRTVPLTTRAVEVLKTLRTTAAREAMGTEKREGESEKDRLARLMNPPGAADFLPDERRLVLPHHLNIRSIQRHVGQGAEACGLQLTFHGLRHVFASRLVQSGAPFSTVAAILGHSDGGSLAARVYGHHQPGNAAEVAMRRYEESLQRAD